MTNPGPMPDDALGGPSSGAAGIEAWGQTTEDQYKQDMSNKVTGGVNPIIGFASSVPILGDLVESLTGVEDGDYTDIGSFVSLLFGRDSSLAARVANLENKIAVGAEYFDNFKRGDNGSVLGSPDPAKYPAWIQFGDGEPLGIYDQAAQLNRNPLPDDGVRYARCPFLATNDDYRVSAVIHPRGTPPNPRTSLYGRCNADMTAGVYVDFYGDRTDIGRFTRSGLNVTRTRWATTGKRYSNSSTVELRMIGTRYQVTVDEIVILDYTDTGTTSPIGNDRRTSGFSMQCWTAILAVPQFSGGLASFAVRANDLNVVTAAVGAAKTEAVSAATTAATTTVQTAVTPVKNQVEAAQAQIITFQEGLPLRPFSHSMTNSEMTFDRTMLRLLTRITRITSDGVPAGGDLPDSGSLMMETGDGASANSSNSTVYTTFRTESTYTFMPASYTLTGGFIRATWGGLRESFTFATGPVSGPCQLCAVVGRMSQTDGSIELLWVSENLTPVIGTGTGEFVVTIPGGVVIGDRETIFVGLHQFGAGGVRPLYGLTLAGLVREGNLFPSKPNARFARTGMMTAGQVIPASSLDFQTDTLPWLGIGPALTVTTPPPTSFYEGFDAATIPSYLVYRSGQRSKIANGAFEYDSTTDGENNYQFTKKLNRDNHYVEGELSGGSDRFQYLSLRADPNGANRVALRVSQKEIAIVRRDSSSDVLASSVISLAAGAVVRFAAVGNYLAGYVVSPDGTATLAVQYTDSANALPRGQTNRYITIGTSRSSFGNSAGWRWIRASDFPDPEA